MAGTSARKTGREPVVAGIRSVEYVYESADHRWAQQIDFAPALGCTAVAYHLTKRNAAGWKISEDDERLVSVNLGEPDQALFVLPNNYRHYDHTVFAYCALSVSPCER